MVSVFGYIESILLVKLRAYEATKIICRSFTQYIVISIFTACLDKLAPVKLEAKCESDSTREYKPV